MVIINSSNWHVLEYVSTPLVTFVLQVAIAEKSSTETMMLTLRIKTKYDLIESVQAIV
jgi:hypothetical protein